MSAPTLWLHGVNAETRFFAGVEGSGDYRECWLWTAAINTDGYGLFSKKGLAHRWLYEHMIGEIPAGLELDHTCRVRRCVNPYHMEPVSGRENRRRSINGELAHLRTTCKKGLHPFVNVEHAVENGKARRRCIECRRIGQRARYRASREAVAA